MGTDLMKRAEKLDQMRSKRISEKLTLEEAKNIVHIWGIYLEHSGTIRYLFGVNMPESFLPYPVDILQGAINRMEAYYHSLGEYDRVKLLEETEMLLVQYVEDNEAIKESIKTFSKKNWQEIFIDSLKNYQLEQAENGFLVDKKLWKLSKSRIAELER